MPWPKTAFAPAILAVLLAVVPACDRVKALLGAEEQAAPVSNDYPVQINAWGDAHAPLAGVQILYKGSPVGSTDPTGAVHLSLKGDEGDVVSLDVKCPEAFASPDKPLSVGLRHFAAGSPPPRFETQCVPLVRSFVVGVRTENGARLPIRRLNKVIGKTDDFGVAHILLEAAPRDQVALTLDTSENEMLRPQNPTLTFVAPDHDQLVLLELKFTLLKRAVHVAPKLIPQKL